MLYRQAFLYIGVYAYLRLYTFLCVQLYCQQFQSNEPKVCEDNPSVIVHNDHKYFCKAFQILRCLIYGYTVLKKRSTAPKFVWIVMCFSLSSGVIVDVGHLKKSCLLLNNQWRNLKWNLFLYLKKGN